VGEDPKALGKAIQAARQTAGMTQQELCHVTGLSYSTLAKIERGAIKTPSVFTVSQIARALHLSMDGLLGAVVDTSIPLPSLKKTSKSGVSFVYIDINGCLVRFFHGAFTALAYQTGAPSDVIESVFWHYNDAVCRGEMTMSEFNAELEKQFGYSPIDWMNLYMDAVEPITEMHELVTWIAKNYRVGLLSNIMPAFISTMVERGLIPNVRYDVIADSSVIGAIKPEQAIYEAAEQLAGVEDKEILFVDDSRTNLMAAERRGWKVLWFDDFDPAVSVDKVRRALEF
jgi:FMN phosphatase YigB (HAD superfamily)